MLITTELFADFRERQQEVKKPPLNFYRDAKIGKVIGKTQAMTLDKNFYFWTSSTIERQSKYVNN